MTCSHLRLGPHWWPYYNLCVCVCVLVTQLCPTLCDPTNCSPPVFSVHGILQARIFEWIAIPFSRGSSRPRDWTLVSCTASRFFTIWDTVKSHYNLITSFILTPSSYTGITFWSTGTSTYKWESGTDRSTTPHSRLFSRTLNLKHNDQGKTWQFHQGRSVWESLFIRSPWLFCLNFCPSWKIFLSFSMSNPGVIMLNSFSFPV